MAGVISADLRLRVEQDPHSTTHRIELDGLPLSVPASARSLYWRIDGRSDLAAPPVLDIFVLALAQQLSVVCDEVRVRGPMTRKGLFNVQRLLEIRRQTWPGHFGHLHVIPDRIVASPHPNGGVRDAVLAFSGGLDSTHAAVWNARRCHREDSFDIRAMVMLLGFDAPLTHRESFERALERARPLSEKLQIPLIAAETNAKSLVSWLWGPTASPIAAAALSMFWETCRYGIFGGAEPYNSYFLVDGHQPLYDQFASNDMFRLVTDGGGRSRKRKLEELGREPAAVEQLRVCWRNADTSKNCGQCEKCTRTQINMRMARLDERRAFETPLQSARLLDLRFANRNAARTIGECVWREIRGDPMLTREADIVRATLARVPPENVAVAARRAFVRYVLPLRIANIARQAWRAARRVAGAVRRGLAMEKSTSA